MATHAARLSKSKRLQTVLGVLADGQWHTGAEIQQVSRSMATHSDIHEIRHNGIAVTHRYNGKTSEGRWISQYRLGEN